MSSARSTRCARKGAGSNGSAKYWVGHCRLTAHYGVMLYLAWKALISGILIAAASTIAKRYPGFGALIASLPLVSVLGMIWLWSEKPDAENMAAHAGATFWYVLPSLPMFLLIPALLRHGISFWLALIAGCVLTIILYALMTWLAPRFGLQL
jgi:hypothetical protein